MQTTAVESMLVMEAASGHFAARIQSENVLE
jgi:hypothetical protein